MYLEYWLLTIEEINIEEKIEKFFKDFFINKRLICIKYSYYYYFLKIWVFKVNGVVILVLDI